MTEWVKCPLCGESDMQKEDGVITCTNISCTSNARADLRENLVGHIYYVANGMDEEAALLASICDHINNCNQISNEGKGRIGQYLAARYNSNNP